MDRIATMDAENRLQLPAEARNWFPEGTRFLIAKEGNTVTLKPLEELAAHLAAVDATGDEEAVSWEEIDAEIQSYRREGRTERVVAVGR